jgi:hypothetical protein
MSNAFTDVSSTLSSTLSEEQQVDRNSHEVKHTRNYKMYLSSLDPSSTDKGLVILRQYQYPFAPPDRWDTVTRRSYMTASTRGVEITEADEKNIVESITSGLVVAHDPLTA